MRLNDLLQKWTKECKTIEDTRDMMVQEQLLDTLPRELKIWVAERKPKTSKDAADLQTTICELESMSIAPSSPGVVARTRDHHGTRVQGRYETLQR